MARACPPSVILLAVATLSCCGCGHAESGHDAPRPAASAGPASIGVSTRLTGDVVARVGEVAITSGLALEVARAQKIAPREAVRMMVDEAVLAEAAGAQGAGSFDEVRTRTAAALARALVRRYDDEARAQGPFTDAELAAAMGDAWVDLDRAETRTVVHALIRAGTPDGAAMADKLRAAVVDAADPDAFLVRAKAFPAPPDALIAEAITTPFTEAGRIAVAGADSTLDATFCRVAFALSKVGDTSAKVETSFGWHVIRLVSVQPPVHASRADQVRRLEGQMVRNRLAGRYDRLLAGLRAGVSLQVVGTDDDLRTVRFDVQPSTGPTSTESRAP